MRQDLGDIESLAVSLQEHGLIQPIALERNTLNLIAGGRRLTAMKTLGWTVLEHGKHFVYHDEMSEATRRELELEENVRRKDMSWKERVLTIAEIHKLKSTKAILSSERWGLREAGELLGMSMANVSLILRVAQELKSGTKEVLASETLTEAIKCMIRAKEVEAQALLAKNILQSGAATKLGGVTSEYLSVVKDLPTEIQSGTLVEDGEVPFEEFMARLNKQKQQTESPVDSTLPLVEIPLSRMLIHTDCLDFMSKMNPESVDHIITDPPYGIDMDMLDQQNLGMKEIDSVKAEHTVEGNLDLMKKFLPLAFKILKDKGFLIFWYDMDHHEKLQGWARNAGFKVQRWPLVWMKEHQCMNQSAQYNFTKATEVAMVCRKGMATLQDVQNKNYLALATPSNPEYIDLQHPFAKPFKLWQWLQVAVAYEGQLIYDPFAGVGSSLTSALVNKFNILATECCAEHFAKQVIRVSNHYKKVFVNKQIKFI